MRCRPAGFLRRRAVAVRVRVERSRDTHIAPEGSCRLLRDAGLPRLPAEAPEHGLAVLVAPHPVRPPGDAVAVAVVRVGAGEHVGLRDGFQQAHADDRRGDAGRQHRLGMERPVVQARDAIGGCTEADDLAIGQRDRRFFMGDSHRALGKHSLDREVLKLAAVGGVRDGGLPVLPQRRPVGGRLRWDRKAEEHRLSTLTGSGRAAAAVLQMTALAGARVEEGAEPVRGGGRARRRYPDFPEDAVADPEVSLARERHVGGGMRERVPV